MAGKNKNRKAIEARKRMRLRGEQNGPRPSLAQRHWHS